jgi:transposase
MTDEQFARIEHLLAGRPEYPVATAKDNRFFIDAVLWIAHTGTGWRDLPERFGDWNNTSQRFNRWAKSGVWARLMEALDDDLEHLLIDSTVVRARQYSAGAGEKATVFRVQASGAV